MLIFRGLIKALVFVLELGDLINGLNSKLLVGELGDFRVEDLQDLSYRAYTMLYRYQSVQGFIPRPGNVLSPEGKSVKLLTFSKVLWFILMHEIGHIELGHLRPGSVTSTLPNTSLAVSEILDDRKLREFEADQFLWDTLIGSEQSAIGSYVIGPLDMLASLEPNLGVNERSHPKAVNRMQHFLNRCGDSIDEVSRRAVSEIVSRDVGAIRYVARSGNAGFLRVSADESRAALAQLQTLYAACLDPSVASEKDKEAADLWDYFVSYFWHDGELTPDGRVPRAT